MSAKYPRLIEVLRRRTGIGRRSIEIEIEAAGSATDSVLEAARRGGVPIESHPRRLADAVDGDALDEMFSKASSPPENDALAPPGDLTRMVIFDLWGRTFVVTDAIVEVYERRD